MFVGRSKRRKKGRAKSRRRDRRESKASTTSQDSVTTSVEQNELFYAIQTNLFSDVLDVCKRGVDLNATTSTGRSALLECARHGNRVEMTVLLLNVGANPNRTSDLWKNTPLMIAAKRGHVDTVRVLLMSGASPTSQNERGNTALFFAARFGHTDVAEVLTAAVLRLREDNADVEETIRRARAAAIAWSHEIISDMLTDALKHIERADRMTLFEDAFDKECDELSQRTQRSLINELSRFFRTATV